MNESEVQLREHIKNYYAVIEKKYPVIRDNVRVHKWPDKYILYGNIDDEEKKKLVSGSSLIIVNQSGVKLLGLCDGENTTGDIVKIICRETSMNEDEIQFKVGSFLLRFNRSLKQVEFLDNSPAEKRKLNFTGSDNNYSPIHTVMELTDDCNLKCRHCYRLAEKYEPVYMDYENAVRIIEELHTAGVRTLELTGGEFTMHPRFIDIIDYAYERMDLIGLLSNGIFLNRETVEKLSRYKDKLLFSLSLDSHDAEQYANFRGVNPRVHKRLVENIKNLTRSGYLVRITMTYTDETIDQIKDTMDFAKNELNAVQFSFSPHLPLGRAGELNYKYSFNEMKTKLEDIREHSRKYENFVSYLPEDFYSRDGRINMLKNCGLGWKTMTIGPDGNVRPCVMCNENVFSWGNAFAEPLESLLNKPLVKTLAALEVPDNKYCEKCQSKLFCMYCIYRAVIVNVDRISKGLGYCDWARNNIDIFDYINKNEVMTKCVNRQVDSLLG